MTVRIGFLTSGSCVQIEGLSVKGQPWRSIRFPSSVAVIDHPKEGVILFDTGYSERFFQATQRFPESLYAAITPVELDLEKTAVKQLAALGISKKDVKHVVLSHLHADHVAGVQDFSESKIWLSEDGYKKASSWSRLLGLKHGFLRSLLPENLGGIASFLGPSSFVSADFGLGAMPKGADLFGDGSVIAIPLPGHMCGHIGLLVHTQAQGSYLLVGDAAWSLQAIEEERMPHEIVQQLLMDDVNAYRATLHTLHGLSHSRKDLKIVPCHCHKTLETMPTVSSLARPECLQK